MPQFCPVPHWELSQGSQCPGNPSWSGTTVCSQPKRSLHGAITHRGHGTRWSSTLEPAPEQGRSGELQQLHPAPSRTGRDGPAALTHLGTASAPSCVSSAQERCQALLCLPFAGPYLGQQAQSLHQPCCPQPSRGHLYQGLGMPIRL